MNEPKELFKWDSGQTAPTPVTDLTLDTLTFNIANPDVNLYRVAINNLKTDDNLDVGLSLEVGTHLYMYSASARVYFGDGAGGYDTTLYRASASILQTDDSFRINNGLVVGDITTTPLTDQIIAAGTITGIEFIGTGQGSSYGVTLGTDTQVYRYAADVLYTPDSLRVGVGVSVGSATNAPATGDLWTTADIRVAGGLYVGGVATDPGTGAITATGAITGQELIGTGDGSSYGLSLGTDTQIYRYAANVLYTPDSFRTGGGVCVGSATLAPAVGNIEYTGDLICYRNSTEITGLIYVPVGGTGGPWQDSTNWEGSTHTNGQTGTVDVSGFTGAPASTAHIKAYRVQIIVTDTGAWPRNSYFSCGPTSTWRYDLSARCPGTSGGVGITGSADGIVRADTNGDFSWICAAGGNLTCYIRIYGYYI